MYKIINNDLIKLNIAQIRNEKTSNTEFRRSIANITYLAAYEVFKTCALRSEEIKTPLTKTEGVAAKNKIIIIGLLRAALGMMAIFEQLIPGATTTYHLGVFREQINNKVQIVKYYDKIPEITFVCDIFITDIMLATGHSIDLLLQLLLLRAKKACIRVLIIIASQYGLDRITKKYPQVAFFFCQVDPILSNNNYIIPGLGDAGDRFFNT